MALTERETETEFEKAWLKWCAKQDVLSTPATAKLVARFMGYMAERPVAIATYRPSKPEDFLSTAGESLPWLPGSRLKSQ